jgi:hypothetical protein
MPPKNQKSMFLKFMAQCQLNPPFSNIKLAGEFKPLHCNKAI